MPDYLDVGFKKTKLDVGSGGNPLTPSHGDQYTRKDLARGFTFQSQLQYGLGLWVTDPRQVVLQVDPAQANQPWTTGFSMTVGYWDSGLGVLNLPSPPTLPTHRLASIIESIESRFFSATLQSGTVYWTETIAHGNLANDGVNVAVMDTKLLTTTSKWQRMNSTPNFYIARNQHGDLYWSLAATGTNPGGFFVYPNLSIRDVAPQVPEEISGMVCWVNASLSNPFNNNDAIAVWRESGNGTGWMPFRQTTGANQPLFKTAQAGPGTILPIIRFDGVNDYMIADNPGDSSLNIAAPTVFAVFKVTAGAGTNQAIFGKCDATLGTAAREKLHLYKSFTGGTTPTIRWAGGNGTPFVEVTVPDLISLGSYRSVCAVSRAANDHTIYVDGVATNSTTVLDLTTYNTAVASLGASSQTGGNVLSGDVAEVIVYNRALSATEIARVQAYLKAKWNTP